MRGHVTKNSSQRSHFKRVVIGNGDVMLAALPDRQPQVTARLPRDFVAQAPQPFSKVAPETSLGNFILPREAMSTGA